MFGIEVGGTPVGDAGYVEAYLEDKATAVLSKIATVSTKLRDRHLQSLYCVTYYSLATSFHYWLQHCYPHETRDAARRVDTALLQTVALCISDGAVQDPLTLRRLRMPARMYGGGIREQADLAPAAFAGTIHRVLPMLADRRCHGAAVEGFLQLPQLASSVFAAEDAFGAQMEAFLAGRAPMANSFAAAWHAMQAEVGDAPGRRLSRTGRPGRREAAESAHEAARAGTIPGLGRGATSATSR